MRWLHLSDLHIGSSNEAQASAMNQLVSAIEKSSDGRALDLILMTGDLAFSGKSHEYTNLSELLINPLRNLSIAKNAKFIAVPGNHDIDCETSLPITWSGLGKTRQETFWSSDEQGQAIRRNRTSSFDNYTKFLERESILGLNPELNVGKRIDIPIGDDREISIVCLNTAMFSDFQLTDDEEKGKSPLPVQTLRSLTENITHQGPIVVLGHHPVNWFEIQSMHHFLSLLQEIGAIYLHGHLHKIEARFNIQALRTLGFGAAYPTSLDSQAHQPYTSTFAVCEIDNYLHIKFIAWEPDFGQWRPFHRLQSDFSEESMILRGGYVIPIPTTLASSVQFRQDTHDDGILINPELNIPIWIEGDYPDEWASILELLGLITPPFEIIRQTDLGDGIHCTFLVKDRDGSHLIHAASAETSIVTYDHVESANTNIDTLKLDSCIIVTLGTISSAALDLANSLRQRKRIEVLDGARIATRLSESDRIIKHLSGFLSNGDNIVSTPLIVSGGTALLIIDAITNSWFSIVNVTGKVEDEFGKLTSKVREKLPEFKSIRYKSPIGISKVDTPAPAKPFEKDKYLERCLSLFDTANYAGLAAVGVRLPIESLRKVYVPTAANVERDSSALEATNRAIEELVQSLGLDEHQKVQLERQMKATYGIQQTSEVSVASSLYQTLSNILLLGDPGSGKSCFVHTEIMSYCKPKDCGNDDWYSQHVPVFLPLAEYTNENDHFISLLDQCVTHANSQLLSLSRQQLDILLSRGLVALFLDGLDEINSIAARQRVVKEITELVDSFVPIGNRIVLTSRPAAIRDLELPPELTKLNLLGLTDYEIELLATRLFAVRYQSDDDLTNTDREIIRTILNDCKSKPGIRRLARNPLLLTLLVFIYENSGAFAARRHLIYSQAVKTLVSVRHRDIKNAMLSEADLRIRLGKLAVAIFRSQVRALPTRAEVADLLANVMPNNSKTTVEFIQEVAESTGLLLVHPRTRDKSEDLVSFMHHSFLEYYTALGFIEKGNGVETVSEFALNPSWYEIVTLMFGILGEQSDITQGIELLLKQHSDSDFITIGRLELAFDCALECDVPPEATQHLLAHEVHTVLTAGPGLFVSEVRQKLAEKLKLLLETTGSKHVHDMLINGLANEKASIAAAFVDLVAKLGPYSNQNTELLSGISAAFDRNDRVLILAVVNALRELPALRTTTNLRKLCSLLQRGGVLEKSATLQLLEKEPSLVHEFATEVISILQEEKNPLAVTAASCILRSGISQLPEYSNFALLDIALQKVIQSDAPRQSLVGKLRIPWNQLETWIYSVNHLDKQRGFRSLVAVEEDAVKVHDELFKALKRESDNLVLTTILDSLSSYPAAIKSASLADTEVVCKLCKSEFRNVRTAAARSLRSFATIQVVTEALIEQFQTLRIHDSKEANEIIRSLAAHATRAKSCRSVLVAELSQLLRKQSITWSRSQTNLTCKLLIACDQASVKLDTSIATRVFSLVADFRTPTEVRRLAMRLYGQVCPTTTTSADQIITEFSSQDADRRLAAYRTAIQFVQRCRSKIQIVKIVDSSLVQMKTELTKCWQRESGNLTDKFEPPALQEIRRCLIVIESTLVSYKEFSKKIQLDTGQHTKYNN